MTTVWQNATETEVYSAALLLSVAAIVAAERAGRTGERRWTTLAAYLLALAVPLHLSALVAAPVVVLLAVDGPTARRWHDGALLVGATLIAAGVSRLSKSLIAVGIAVMLFAALDARRRGGRLRRSLPAIAVVALALTAILILLVRARFDPPINQANPSTLHALGDVIARRQYEVAGLWPRQAPIWLQIANWFEYADWQFALGLGPTVVPTVPRVAMTLAYAGLGIAGARWHRRADARTWRAVVLLFVCGSLGVIAYLNFKAGASFAWGIIPEDARHEARDRDYFFVLAFWAWGLWAGMGALALARLQRVAWAGVVVAALPIALNWRAVNRRTEPEASMPSMVAESLLEELPRNAVLLVAGDNDTYPLWSYQQVERRRRDVTVVTMPLLAADWYVAELERRAGLASGASLGVESRAASVARSAESRGRPVYASITVPDSARRVIGARWTIAGHVLRLEPSGDNQTTASSPVITIDTPATNAAVQRVDRWRQGRVVHPSVDPVHDYFSAMLDCPRRVLARSPSMHGTLDLGSLDSLCKPR
jgi:hypothetical protein